MPTSEAVSEKESFFLARMYSGANLGTLNLYTNWDRDVSGYAASPTMEIEVPQNEGTFSQKELRIVLPEDDFTLSLTAGRHSPVFLRLLEITRGLAVGVSNIQRYVYTAQLVEAAVNYQGDAGRTGLFFRGIKSRLTLPMSMPCNHQCGWTLFKGGCGVDESSYEITATIDSITGPVLTVSDTDVTTPGTADIRYWKGGYVEVDGLRITIYDYDGSGDPELLRLVEPPPASWSGASARIVPGCDKLIETCRDRYNAEQYFAGLGYKMLPYNPLIESP